MTNIIQADFTDLKISRLTERNFDNRTENDYHFRQPNDEKGLVEGYKMLNPKLYPNYPLSPDDENFDTYAQTFKEYNSQGTLNLPYDYENDKEPQAEFDKNTVGVIVGYVAEKPTVLPDIDENIITSYDNTYEALSDSKHNKLNIYSHEQLRNDTIIGKTDRCDSVYFPLKQGINALNGYYSKGAITPIGDKTQEETLISIPKFEINNIYRNYVLGDDMTFSRDVISTFEGSYSCVCNYDNLIKFNIEDFSNYSEIKNLNINPILSKDGVIITPDKNNDFKYSYSFTVETENYYTFSFYARYEDYNTVLRLPYFKDENNNVVDDYKIYRGDILLKDSDRFINLSNKWIRLGVTAKLQQGTYTCNILWSKEYLLNSNSVRQTNDRNCNLRICGLQLNEGSCLKAYTEKTDLYKPLLFTLNQIKTEKNYNALTDCDWTLSYQRIIQDNFDLRNNHYDSIGNVCFGYKSGIPFMTRGDDTIILNDGDYSDYYKYTNLVILQYNHKNKELHYKCYCNPPDKDINLTQKLTTPNATLNEDIIDVNTYDNNAEIANLYASNILKETPYIQVGQSNYSNQDYVGFDIYLHDIKADDLIKTFDYESESELNKYAYNKFQYDLLLGGKDPKELDNSTIYRNLKFIIGNNFNDKRLIQEVMGYSLLSNDETALRGTNITEGVIV